MAESCECESIMIGGEHIFQEKNIHVSLMEGERREVGSDGSKRRARWERNRRKQQNELEL